MYKGAATRDFFPFSSNHKYVLKEPKQKYTKHKNHSFSNNINLLCFYYIFMTEIIYNH